MSAPLQTKTDQRIRDEILARLAWDCQIDPSTVSIVVNNGAVRLEGRVGQAWRIAAASIAASEAPGVGRIDNQLKLCESQPSYAGIDEIEMDEGDMRQATTHVV